MKLKKFLLGIVLNCSCSELRKGGTVGWTKDLDLDLMMESWECSAAVNAIQESMPKNSKGEPLQEIDEEQASNTEDSEPWKSNHLHTYTEKGLQYQLSLKENDYLQAKRKLQEKVDSVSMIWIQAVCVATHKGCQVKMWKSLIYVWSWQSEHLVKEILTVQLKWASKLCFLFWKLSLRTAI